MREALRHDGSVPGINGAVAGNGAVTIVIAAPAATRKYEVRGRLAAQQAMDGQPPITAPVGGARAGGGSRRRLEQALQRSVVEHLRRRARQGTWWCHLPNGGARSKIEAAIFQGLGVRCGAPDLLVAVGGQACFLELKAPSGRITTAQSECHAALRAAGAR